jgi:hypothetical protein
MKNVFALTMATVFGLFLVTGALAGQTQAERSYLGKPYIGTVVTVDSSTNTLVVKNWKGETSFDTSNARFVGRSGLKELDPGKRVLIRYSEADGKMVAMTVIEAAFRHESTKKENQEIQVARPSSVQGAD